MSPELKQSDPAHIRDKANELNAKADALCAAYDELVREGRRKLMARP
jgi:hypothetical protein